MNIAKLCNRIEYEIRLIDPKEVSTRKLVLLLFALPQSKAVVNTFAANCGGNYDYTHSNHGNLLYI